jgi:hypothetical protein
MLTPSTLPTRRGPKKRRYEVRVVDDGQILSDWMPATRIDHSRFLVESHPVFGGAALNKGDVEVRRI